jgi:hypothetical protein
MNRKKIIDMERVNHMIIEKTINDIEVNYMSYFGNMEAFWVSPTYNLFRKNYSEENK